MEMSLALTLYELLLLLHRGQYGQFRLMNKPFHLPRQQHTVRSLPNRSGRVEEDTMCTWGSTEACRRTRSPRVVLLPLPLPQ